MNARLAPFRTYFRDARDAVSHAPIEVALGLLAAVTFSVALEADDWEVWQRMIVTAALALPLVFATSVLHVRGVVGARWRWVASALVLIAAAVYGGVAMDPEAGAEWWRFTALQGVALALVSLAPVPRGEDREDVRLRFWRFNARLLARATVVFAYGLVLFGALAGAVAAVAALFELDTPDHLYGHLWGWIAFALVPWVVVGGLPELIEEPAEEHGAGPRAIRMLGRYLYAPVLTIYLAILIAYAVKVVVTQELPQNVLSPIVLLAGAIGFLCAIFFEPLHRDSGYSGVARLIRIFPAILLPLLPLAIWAVWVRREQYGWTEFRYLRLAVLLALVVLAVAGVHRLLTRRRPVLLLVPIVFGATLVLAAVGPWSAMATSRRNQTERLLDALREAGFRTAEQRAALIAPGTDSVMVDSAAYSAITGSARYLLDAHGRAALRPVFPTLPDTLRHGWQLARDLRLAVRCTPTGSDFVHAEVPPDLGVPGVRGGTLHRLDLHARPPGASRNAPSPETAASFRDASGAEFRAELRGDAIAIRRRGAEPWAGNADLAALREHVESRIVAEECTPHFRGFGASIRPDEAIIPIVDGLERRRGQVIVTGLEMNDRGRRDPAQRGEEDMAATITRVTGQMILFSEPANGSAGS